MNFLIDFFSVAKLRKAISLINNDHLTGVYIMLWTLPATRCDHSTTMCLFLRECSEILLQGVPQKSTFLRNKLLCC